MAFGSSVGGFIGVSGGGNIVGGAIVRLMLDQAQFQKGLTGAQARMTMLGRNMSAVGGALTKGLTVPVVAAAGASVKLAMDFEQAFTRIDAVSNASARDIAKWKDEVLGLAGATGKAPQELADALFFLASAGLGASEIMPILEMSAKASAVGLGDMSEIAKLTAQTLNNYRESGLTAADATDILVAAVKAGTAEPAEFAESMGRILPIAAKSKVGFDEIAGSMAGLSTIGLDVNEAVTAMRGVLMALQAPGSQAAQTLSEIGISTDELRAAIADEGILGAMTLLEEATGGNIDQLRKIIPNVRALSGQFALTGENAANMRDIFNQTASATGELDKAFKTTEKDSAFKFQQAMAKLKSTAIEVGATLLPVVTDIVKTVGDLAKKFSDMSPAAKEFWVKLVLIAAALGPVLMLLGGIVRLAAPVVGAFTKMAGAAAAAGAATKGAGAATTGAAAAVKTPLATWAVGLTTVAMAATAAYRANKDLLAQDIAGHFVKSSAGARLLAIASVEVGSGQKALMDILAGVTTLTGEQELKIAAVVESLHKWGGSLTDTERKMVNNLLRVGDYGGALKLLQGILDATAGKLGGHRKGINDAAGAAADAGQKVKAFGQKVKELPEAHHTKITADTSSAMVMLQRLQDKYRAIKNEIENTIHVNVVPGNLGPLKPSGGGGGGGGGGGSAQQLGIRAPAFALAPATGGGGTQVYAPIIVNGDIIDTDRWQRKVVDALGSQSSNFSGR